MSSSSSSTAVEAAPKQLTPEEEKEQHEAAKKAHEERTIPYPVLVVLADGTEYKLTSEQASLIKFVRDQAEMINDSLDHEVNPDDVATWPRVDLIASIKNAKDEDLLINKEMFDAILKWVDTRIEHKAEFPRQKPLHEHLPDGLFDWELQYFEDNFIEKGEGIEKWVDHEGKERSINKRITLFFFHFLNVCNFLGVTSFVAEVAPRAFKLKIVSEACDTKDNGGFKKGKFIPGAINRMCRTHANFDDFNLTEEQFNEHRKKNAWVFQPNI